MSKGKVILKRVMVLLLATSTISGFIPQTVFANELISDEESLIDDVELLDINEDIAIESPCEIESVDPAPDGESLETIEESYEEFETEESLVVEEELDDEFYEDLEVVEELDDEFYEDFDEDFEDDEFFEEEAEEPEVIKGHAPEGYASNNDYIAELKDYYGDDIMDKIDNTIKNPNNKNVANLLTQVVGFGDPIAKSKASLEDENGKPVDFTVYEDEYGNYYAAVIDKENEQIKVMFVDYDYKDDYDYPEPLTKKEVNNLIKKYGDDSVYYEEAVEEYLVVSNIVIPESNNEVSSYDISYYQGEDEIIFLHNYYVKVGNKTYQTSDGSLKFNDDFEFYYMKGKKQVIVNPFDYVDEDSNEPILKSSPLSKKEVEKLLTTYEDIGSDLWFAGYDWEEETKEKSLGYIVTLFNIPYYYLGYEICDLRIVAEDPIDEVVEDIVESNDPVVSDVPSEDSSDVPSDVPSDEIDKPSDEPEVIEPVIEEPVIKPVKPVKPSKASTVTNIAVDASSEIFASYTEAVNTNNENTVIAGDTRVVAVRDFTERDLTNQNILLTAYAKINNCNVLNLKNEQIVLAGDSGEEMPITIKNVNCNLKIGTKVHAICWNTYEKDYVIDGVVTDFNQVTFEGFKHRSLTNVSIFIEY